MISMQLAGQTIVYKDLVDLRGKLTELLQKSRQDREIHDRESKRLRQEEKSLLKMLGSDASTPEDQPRSQP